MSHGRLGSLEPDGVVVRVRCSVGESGPWMEGRGWKAVGNLSPRGLGGWRDVGNYEMSMGVRFLMQVSSSHPVPPRRMPCSCRRGSEVL